jgi:hypothetical protein
MIRPFTFLCLAAACGSGLYLYTEKHRAEMLDREIAHVIRATEAARQTTSLLHAEWGLLNNPDRLRPMAEKYLALTTMQPAQWVQLADLGSKLPPPAPPAPTGGTDDGAVAANDPVPPDAPLVPAPANPGVPEAQPVGMPEAQPVAVPARPAAHAPAVKPVVKLAHAAPKKPAPVTLADRDAPLSNHPLARGTPLPLATPQPARARVMAAMARPMPMRVAPPVVVSAVPSALGVRSAVPAPVPYGAQ